jgi:hypothetical protein
VWACDDDFYNLDVLRKGVSFLRQNSEYASYVGEVIDFNVLPRFGTFDRSKGSLWIRENNRFCSGRYKHHSSIHLESATRRLGFIDSIAPTEAIHRTKVLQQSFEVLNKVPIQHIMSINFMIGVVGLSTGKLYVTDNLMLLRQDNTPGSAGAVALGTNDYSSEIQERLKLLGEVRRQLNLDVSVVEEFLLSRSNIKFEQNLGAMGSQIEWRFPGSRVFGKSIGFLLYLRLFIATLKMLVARRASNLALVDSSILTNENMPFVLKVRAAVSSFTK